MKKVISLLCVVLLISVILISCASNDSGSNVGSNNNTSTRTETGGAGDKDAAPSDEPVTLRVSWWGGETRHSATLDAFDAYTALHPNVSFEGEYSGSTGPYLTKLLTQLAGDTAPDIIQIDYKWVRDLSQQSDNFVNFYDILDRIDITHIDMDLAKEYTAYGDFLLGLPVGMNAIGFMYNPAVFEEHGLEMIEKPTWNDIIDLGTKLHQADNSKHLLIPHINHYYSFFKMMTMQRSGTNLIDDDDYSILFSRDDALQFFTYLKEMLDTGTLPPLEESLVYGTSYVDQIPEWHNGNYAMTSISASVLATMIQATDFPVEVARAPILEDAVDPGIFTPVSMMFGINKKSKHVDQAIDFINWYMNDDEAIMIMKSERGVPVNTRAREMLEDANHILPNVSKSIQLAAADAAGKSESALDTNPELHDIFIKHWQLMGFGQATPEQAVDAYMAELEQALNSMKK